MSGMLENEKCLLENSKRELMRRYGEQNTVIPSNVGKQVNSVATRLLGMLICISSAIPKWCLWDISELNYFRKDLRGILTELFERSSKKSIDIRGGQRAVSLDLFSLIEDGIYMRWSIFKITLLVQLAEKLFESSKKAAGFWKRDNKNGGLRDVSNNDVLKARLRKSLSDTSSVKQRTVKDVYLQVLGCQWLVGWFSVAKKIDQSKKKVEFVQANENLLNLVGVAVKNWKYDGAGFVRI